MTTAPIESDGNPPHAARAVLAWCLLAGVLVGGMLLVDRPDARGLAFWHDVGAFRLLVDLVLFHVLFLLPAFVAFDRRVSAASCEAAAIVLVTALTALAMLNVLVGLDAPAFRRLCGFIVLVGVAAWTWAFAVGDGRAVYYPVVATAAVGMPMVAFFCDELFAIRAGWLDVLSPFTAWRCVVDGDATAPAAWVLYGVLLTAGAAAWARRMRKECRA